MSGIKELIAERTLIYCKGSSSAEEPHVFRRENDVTYQENCDEGVVLRKFISIVFPLPPIAAMPW